MFLKMGAATVGTAVGTSSAWLNFSNSRRARMLREILADVTRRPLSVAQRPTPNAWPDERISLAWIGHATVLINFYGLTVLTDPVLSSRVGFDLRLATLGPKRRVAPALALKQLPPVDLVLLSHAHMDHMDLPTLAALPPTTPIITAADTSDLLGPLGGRDVSELAWGQHRVFDGGKGDLRVEAFEVKHWGARVPGGRPRGYNGYVLSREGRRLLFGGDTAFTPLFRNLRRLGPFDAAIMPIGSYRPWTTNHCTPEEALSMADAAGAQRLLPIHYATFKLSDEPFEEPMLRLERALEKESGRIGWRQIGETLSLA